MPARSTRPHEIKVLAELSSESEEKRRNRGVGERDAGPPHASPRNKSLCQAFFRKRVESGRNDAYSGMERL